jgi:flagellar motility protein MotE (MotC chaperone)
MPELDGGNAAKTEGAPASPSGSKSKLIPIVGGVAVFVVFVVIFSLKYGVFSSAKAPETAAEVSPQKARADSLASARKEEDSIKAEESAYDNLFTEFDDSHVPDEGNGDTTTAKDSVAKAAWYESQKAEIAAKTLQLESEKAQLQSLKSEVETLLQRKKSQEECNIAQMAKLYEGMATEEIVPILEKLTDAQVSIMISKMKKQKASEVLGKMTPERAAKITQYIISMSEN